MSPRGPLAPLGLGSVAPHAGEGQLPWVLNGAPAWGEMPQPGEDDAPAFSYLLCQI